MGGALVEASRARGGVEKKGGGGRVEKKEGRGGGEKPSKDESGQVKFE